MSSAFGPLVDIHWLRVNLSRSDLRVFDVRFNLNDPDQGRRAYLEGHIPGAVFLDLERDLSGPVGRHGGRHPLPDPEQLAARLRSAGLNHSDTAVVYDDGSGQSAPRAWWLLGYLGLERVAVLDGGFAAWSGAGLPVVPGTGDEEAAARGPQGNFTVRLQRDWIRDTDQVRTVVQGGARDGRRVVLVDSRAPERYRGEVEPYDPVAGHIPGAVNYDWTTNVGPDGRWLDPSTLRQRFAALEGADEIIVYCGSGVTACANLLALRLAGFQQARLYPGSWSDWCSYPEHPVAQGSE